MAVATMLLPDGTPIATSEDGTARVWDLTTGRELGVQPTPRPIGALSTLGNCLVVGFGWEVACFEIEKGQAR